MIKDLGIVLLITVIALIAITVPYLVLILGFKLAVLEASSIIFAMIAMIFAITRILINEQ